VKLGINGATMYPWSLEAQIAKASSAGFEGLELWRDKVEQYLAGHERAELVDLLASHHIEPTTMCFVYLGYGDEQQAERVKTLQEMVDLAAGVGAGSIAVCASRNPPEGVSKAEVLRLATAEAKIMVAIAADQGVELFLEPLGLHPVVPGPREAMEIIEGVGSPNVKILFDVFHYYRSSVSLEDIAATPVERLGAIHVNDGEGLPKGELNDFKRLYPTLGVLPVAEMLRIPRDRGFEGYVVVEVFRQEYWDNDPDLAAHSMKYLKVLLAQVPWERGGTK
jgi:sugar phosphate isomerase/epimerase